MIVIMIIKLIMMIIRIMNNNKDDNDESYNDNSTLIPVKHQSNNDGQRTYLEFCKILSTTSHYL